MKYVRYQSIGHTVGLKENIDDYWEIDATAHVTRSIHQQVDGILKYDVDFDADSFGQLPEGTISDENLNDPAYGQITSLTLSEFEMKWSEKAKNRVD